MRNAPILTVGPKEEPSAWWRTAAHLVEHRRTSRSFGQCGHLTRPEFTGWVIFDDPLTRVCEKCIEYRGDDTSPCDRCEVVPESLVVVASAIEHTKLVASLCVTCAEKEVGDAVRCA